MIPQAALTPHFPQDLLLFPEVKEGTGPGSESICSTKPPQVSAMNSEDYEFSCISEHAYLWARRMYSFHSANEL